MRFHMQLYLCRCDMSRICPSVFSYFCMLPAHSRYLHNFVYGFLSPGCKTKLLSKANLVMAPSSNHDAVACIDVHPGNFWSCLMMSVRVGHAQRSLVPRSATEHLWKHLKIHRAFVKIYAIYETH